MKQLTWKLVLPLTIISFTVFTKWWDVGLDDYREILRGFPLPFVCPGWHTSLSLRIFVLEFIVDVFVYFLFWLIVIMTLAKTVKSFHVPKPVAVTLVSSSGLLTIILVLIAFNPDNVYSASRPFNIEVIETGFRFIWQEQTHPNYEKYPFKR